MERKTMPRAVAAGAGLLMGSLALVGCAHYEHVDTTEAATVIQHNHQDAYTSFILAGKVLVPIYHPEQFDLEMRQCGKPEGENVDASGCVNEEVTVTKDQYGQFKDGDTVILAHK